MSGGTFFAHRDERAQRIAEMLAPSVRFFGGHFTIDRAWPARLLPASIVRDIEQLAAEYHLADQERDPMDAFDEARARPKEGW